VVELAIGLGIALNLILTEVCGFASAGLVVPGYLALYLDQPGRVLATWVVALSTWACVRYGLGRLVVLYGRRRFGVTVLTGFLLNAGLLSTMQRLPAEPLDLRAIGYIVPGLIANTALAQGVWPTLVCTFLVAACVRLLLLLIAGWAG
jgi:poly-gamma-glutamate biosynthesis protein PgsC/CapC